MTPSIRKLGLTPALTVFLFALLAGPVVMYVALVRHAENEALKDARAFTSVISIVRSYYASNVSSRILRSNGHAVLSERYAEIPGGVPIPATLSIELGDKIRKEAVDKSFQFAFVSDAPFKNRPRPALTDFQGEALKSFRRQDSAQEYFRVEEEGGVQRLRLAIPVRMEQGCVSCHNVHPDSPVRTWKVGDVRGIQDVSVDLAVMEQADQSLMLALYFLLFTGSGVVALFESRRNNASLRRVNGDLETSRRELEARSAALNETIGALRTRTTVLEKAPFGIFLAEPVDDRLRMSYVNPTFCQQTGFLSDELVGRTLQVFQGPQTSAEAISAIQSALEARRTAEVELVIHCRDGAPLWSRFLLFPSYGADGQLQHFVGCLTDISELKRAEEDRHRIAGELHESLKLESLGLTIAGIAHDLNTPIGVAITAASHLEQSAEQFARKAAAAPPAGIEVETFVNRMQRSLTLVRNNLQKAAVLVRSFKQTTADATRTEWRQVNLKSFMEMTLVSVSPLMKRARCEVRISCPEALMLHTEPGSLGRVLTNLLVNASIHAFEGREDRVVQLDVARLDVDTIRLSVADNGVGMSEEVMAKAFTPFFTTRRGAGGSGLGLFSSRRSVEQVLGGRLSLQPRMGGGTTFHIDLPFKGPQA